MAKTSRAKLVTLTDDDDVDHELELLETFKVGEQDYALLCPAGSTEHELAILKCKRGRRGALSFETPTRKELDAAVEAIELSWDSCGCPDEAADQAQGEGCSCCGCAGDTPARKKKPATKPAKMAPAKRRRGSVR